MHTIEHDGVTVTVQGLTGADELSRPMIEQIIIRHLVPEIESIEDLPSHTYNIVYVFVAIVLQTVKVDGLPFTFPTRYSGAKALIPAFHSLMEAPEYRALLDEWWQAITAVNYPPAEKKETS